MSTQSTANFQLTVRHVNVQLTKQIFLHCYHLIPMGYHSVGDPGGSSVETLLCLVTGPGETRQLEVKVIHYLTVDGQAECRLVEVPALKPDPTTPSPLSEDEYRQLCHNIEVMLAADPRSLTPEQDPDVVMEIFFDLLQQDQQKAAAYWSLAGLTVEQGNNAGILTDHDELATIQRLHSALNLTPAQVRLNDNYALYDAFQWGNLDIASWLIDTFHLGLQDVRDGEGRILQKVYERGHIDCLVYLVEKMGLTRQDLAVVGISDDMFNNPASLELNKNNPSAVYLLKYFSN